jgi:cob(I)alamin adenosyltransferase
MRREAMGNRLSSIITRTGDDGSTMLGDGSRLLKNDIRIQCLGEADELNSLVGLLLSLLNDIDISQTLFQIQHDLFDLGAELSQPDKSLITKEYVEFLDQQAQSFNEKLPALKEFILPGGSTAIAYLHLARTQCRRVERSLVTLAQQQAVNPQSLRYMNRLSDLFFILARYSALQDGCKEVYWQSKYSRQS